MSLVPVNAYHNAIMQRREESYSSNKMSAENMDRCLGFTGEENVNSYFHVLGQ